MTTILWKIPRTSVSSRGADAFPKRWSARRFEGHRNDTCAGIVGNRGIDEMSPETAKPRMFGIPDS